MKIIGVCIGMLFYRFVLKPIEKRSIQKELKYKDYPKL